MGTRPGGTRYRGGGWFAVYRVILLTVAPTVLAAGSAWGGQAHPAALERVSTAEGAGEAQAPAEARQLVLVAGHMGGVGSLDGTGTAARFNGPWGIAAAPGKEGILYIADTRNHTIRRVDVRSGAVSTLAGRVEEKGSADGARGEARFTSPLDVAVGLDGTVYVADSENHTIRKVDPVTGAVTTLVGKAGEPGATDGKGGGARFNTPRGLAMGPGTALYVADSENHTLRKVDTATGEVTTLAGQAGYGSRVDGVGSAARFHEPRGMAVGPDGTLYVTDTLSNSIRRVSPATGAVTTLVGAAGLGFADGAASLARFYRPRGITLGPGGTTLYVADTANDVVREVDVATGAVTTLAGTPNLPGTDDGVGAKGLFTQPEDIAAGPDGLLFVVDRSNTLRVVDPATRAVRTFAGAADCCASRDGVGAAAGFSLPARIAVGPDGTAYVVDTNDNVLRKIDAASGMVSTLAGAPQQSGSADGIGASARFASPHGVAVGPDGSVYVADGWSFTIRKVNPSTGAVTTLAGKLSARGSADGTGKSARFHFPRSLAVGSDGNLYVIDGDSVRKVNLKTRAVATIAGSAEEGGSVDGKGPAARFSSPKGLVAGTGGVLYVSDTFNHAIRRIDLKTRAVTTLAGTAGASGHADGVGAAARFKFPEDIATSLDGSTLYVADMQNHSLRRIDVGTDAVSTLVGRPDEYGIRTGRLDEARLCHVRGVAVSAQGDVFITARGAVLRIPHP